MNLLTISKSKPTVVVGVDFGTSFSGFAFARISDPDDVHKFYDWPSLEKGGGGHYCKTQTSLLYKVGDTPGSYVLQDWGYSALVKHSCGLLYSRRQQITQGEDVFGIANECMQDSTNESDDEIATYFITLFKLHLASSDSGQTSAPALPRGLTPRRLISDYLRKLSELVMKNLKGKMGSHITMDDVQWCFTVPPSWDEVAKQDMKICAALAGMVQGLGCPKDCIESASPHPIIIVTEPMAASLYCEQKLKCKFGEKFLIVDIGGKSVDLVVHEKVGKASSLNRRKVSPSSSGETGGSYVDMAFFEFLSKQMPCFEGFIPANTDSILELKGLWENIKHGFDGNMNVSYDLQLPARLAGAHNRRTFRLDGLEETAIKLSLDDMLSLFDPVVDEIIELIEQKLSEGSQNVKAMMIVGGFSGSPYLVKKIRDKFSTRIGAIVIPDEPGSAVSCGAVRYGLYRLDVIMSRTSKETSE